MASGPKSLPAPRGQANSWMMGRQCCCTYGFYPLLVAPIITIAFLISVYSSMDCRFLEVDVGFTPNNHAWNESELEVGFFYQYRPGVSDQRSDYLSHVYDSCHHYSNTFEKEIIEMDQTWKAARMMSHIASLSGFLAAAIAWAIVVFPLPAGCLWPSLLLPCVILAFIGEGSKFLFVEVALCRQPIWFPTAAESVPTTAESCTLGWSAYACIVAGALQGIGLLLVCMKTPRKRQIERKVQKRHRPEPNFEEPEHLRTSFEENKSPLVIHGLATHCETRQLSMDEEWQEDETNREGTSVISPVDSYVTGGSTLFDLHRKRPSWESVSESRLSVKSKMENDVYVCQRKDKRVSELIADLEASFNGSGSRTDKSASNLEVVADK
ncbi:hypothetical protein FisN_2Lh225 [Fistulifera solaris]|uniref:Uncharacterized protein n=1 Tax=Fistulifera solaris TaxID=1519565 RepID=A0A1Z5KFB9_FISSO|nr:hypothetical protein FisN_2Lh225 [Fistulifera solaris]|eukprot:GAX24949.1 hypothetical protein FisN_2Lh225 [Fistulifera solaris]